MTRRLVLGYLTITVIVLVILEIPLAVFYGQREEERLIADAEKVFEKPCSLVRKS